MKRRIFLPLLLLWLATSCFDRGADKPGDPESALKGYIKYRFSEGQTKKGLLEKTTGRLRADLEQLSEEDLKELVKKHGPRRARLIINLKKQEPKRSYITYTLKFDQFDGNKKSFQVEIKKIARIDLEEGVWKLAQINDIKTHFQANQDLNVESDGEVIDPFK